MLRLRCECKESALEIKPEGEKVRLSVPCVYCKEEHSFSVSSDILNRDLPFSLLCPFSHHEILFIADEEAMGAELERSRIDLETVLKSFEADDIKDIQPMDIDDAEAAPDPAVFDVLNFLLRDLTEAGGVTCPCKKGPYSLRFAPEGAEAVCDSCGARFVFHALSGSAAESYLGLDALHLG